MKVALIATGNEIVSGQTLNTNSTHLAKLLESHGSEVVFHMSVLDREEDLKAAFDFLKSREVSDIITTGGLGPTRDDLTRKIIADYLDQGFAFEEKLWKKLEAQLIERQITPRKGHEWQCYFPLGSKILKNTKGTAQGFKVEGKGLRIWCFPGPPKELESVCEHALIPWLKENVKLQKRLLTWQCKNVPESELAHRVEEKLKGCPYEIGFRASPPIVEVKMWIPEEDADPSWEDKMDTVTLRFLESKRRWK